MLHFSYPDELALDIWTLNSTWLDDLDNLRGLGLLVYGTYMAFNSIRHKGITDSQQAFHCISQHCKQGALGHAASMRFLDSRWRSPISYIL